MDVQKDATSISSGDEFEEGQTLTVSYSANTGYENASLKIKKASDNSDVTGAVLSGSTITVPDYAIKVVATAIKKNYTVTLSAANGKIQVGGVDKESITVAHGETAELTAVANDGYAFDGWTSNSANVVLTDATVNPATITVTGVGTITANFVSTLKPDPEISWSAPSAAVVKGQTASLPTFNNPHTLNVAYSSTDEGVAQIDNVGNITINGVGTTTIKATYEEGVYAGKEVSYTLTVKGRVTWHIIKEGVDATSYADYAKDAVPTKPVGVTSCDASISLVGWTTSTYAKSDDAPTPLYTEDVPAVTDNADYYAVWANVEEGGWNEITSVANLTAGTYAICSDYYFMKAVKVDSKNRLQNGGEPSISEGKLTSAPAADCQWTISINGDGKYLFQNGDKYAIATSTKNEMILSSVADIAEDAHAQWEIARSGSIFEVTNIGRAGDSDTPANKYLRNNTTSGWACYSSNQGGEGYAPRFFKYSAGSATGYTTNCVPPMTVATPTFTPDGSAAYYTEAQTVTISCATVGATIYYSLDETDPSVEYTAPISIDETKTLKAKAVLEDVSSEIAEATFTINLPLTTIQGIFDEATAIGSSAAQERIITFNSWVVSAIGSDEKSVYVTDGEKGFVIYGSDHGFAVGNILSGTVTCNLQLFGDFAEIKGMKSSAQGLNVTTGGTLNPQEVSLKNLGAINTGAPIIINNVTYDNDGDLVDAESYYATPVEWLYSFETSTFETNKIYKVTGIYIYGSNSDKIVPRDADDIVKLTKEQPTLTWKINDTPIGESYSIDNKDVPFAPVCVANSTGSKSYESSNTSVATIDENGVLTVIGNGVTTITCTVAEDDDYVEGSKSFTLKVGVYDATWVAATWATAESVASNTKMADKSPIAIDANLSMTWSKAEGSNDPIYHSDGEGRLYQKNTLTITASNSKQITRIEFHFKTGYAGTISADAGTFENGVWTGFAPSVTFTNGASASQARIQSIDIEYAQGITTTLVIEDIARQMTDASAQAIVYTSNKKPSQEIVYSGYDETVISIEDGSLTPLKVGSTTVTASIAADAPYSSVVTTFKVTVTSGTEVVENVVILAQKDGVWYALTNQQGSANNSLAAQVVDYRESINKILDLDAEKQAALIWKRTIDGNSVTFQDANDKYLTGASSGTNLSVADAKCVWAKSGDNYLQGDRSFLYSTTNGYFRCYTPSTAGVTDMPIVPLSEGIFVNHNYERDVTVGRMGTVCVDHNVPAGYIFGAEVYKLLYWKYGTSYADCQMVDFEQVEEMEAGHPYLIIPTETKFMLVYGETHVDDPVALSNGFMGTFDPIAQADDNVLVGKYGVVNNQIQLLGPGAYSPANRAFIDLSQTPSMEAYEAAHPSNPAPRKRISLSHQGAQVATGMDALNASDAPVKVLINGQLFIIRGEKMFDAKGQLVK